MIDEALRDWAGAAAAAAALTFGGLQASAGEPAAPIAATSVVNNNDKELLDAYTNYQKMLKYGNKNIASQNAAETRLDHLVIRKFSFLRDKNGDSDQTHKNIEEYLKKGGSPSSNNVKQQQVKKATPTPKTIQTRSESPDLGSE